MTRWIGMLLAVASSTAAPAADGPHVPPKQQDAVAAEHLAAPKHYDIFFGRKDRQYLTGVWKLKIARNDLTRKWIADNMAMTKRGKSPVLAVKPGVKLPAGKIAPRPEHLDIRAETGNWWDVLVPWPWNQRMPYERPASRAACDYYNKHLNTYALGGVGFYRKTFRVPKAKAGLRAVLHLDSVESECVVWVNGRRVGGHRNWRHQGTGRVPAAFMEYFDIEVTDALRCGQDNLITVGVCDTGVPFVWGRPDPGGITGLVWIDYHPPSYFRTVRVAAAPDADRLTVSCLPAPGPAAPDRVAVRVTPWESPDYAFSGRKKTYRADVALQKPDPTGWRRFELDAPGLCRWEPESPCLYELRILDAAGRTLALDRFGARTFEARGTRFFLNGKGVFLFGQNAGAIIHVFDAPGSVTPDRLNRNNAVRRLLGARRRAGMTSQRVHTGPVHRLAYHLCDEVGLMVRAEWTPSDLTTARPEDVSVDYLGGHDLTAAFDTKRKAFAPKLLARLAKWLDHTGNSPCVITWSGGNEMAAGDADVRLYCRLLCEFIRAHDPQRRPFTHSSGLHWERGDAKLRRTPLPCDYLDYHNYQMIYRRWPAAAKSYAEEFDDLMRIYGGHRVPVVNGEWLAHGGMEARLCAIAPGMFDRRGEPSVAGYVEHVSKARTRQDPYRHQRIAREFLARVAVGGCRAVRSILDDAEARARYYHRSVEIIRRDCPREVGYSIHGLCPNVLRKIVGGKRTDEYGSPEMAALRMAQQPLIAVPDFWQRHVLAGEPLGLNVHVINASRKDFAGTLRAALEAADGKAVAVEEVPVKTLGVGQRRVLPAPALKAPTTAAPGVYRLVLDLHDGQRSLSRNVHRVLVRSPAEFGPIAASRRAGLYEVPTGPDTAAGMLEAFAVKAARVTDLKAVGDLDVLILGRDSIDANVWQHRLALRRFVEAGGTIVAFEQAVSTPLPWAPAVYYEHCGPVPIADPLRLDHPAFRGLLPLDLEDWPDGHAVYDNLIQPLGTNVLVGGAGPRVGFAHTAPADFGMAVAEFRIGKGTSLLCQLRVARNYRRDSAARLLGYNILRYALAPPGGSAAAVAPLAGDAGGVSEKPILARDQVACVNFYKLCNRSISAREGKGFFGLGIGLDDIPRGVKLFGGVPFRIRTESSGRPNVAVVLGSSPRHPQPAFPTALKDIGVWKKLRTLYFLHTSAYTTPTDGEEVCRYVIHRGKGAPAVFVVRNRRDIADWHKAKSHANAKAVWYSGSGKAVFLTAWTNPEPDNKISKIDVIAAGRGYVALLGITGVLSAEPKGDR